MVFLISRKIPKISFIGLIFWINLSYRLIESFRMPPDVDYDFKDGALVYRTTVEKMEVPPEAEMQFKACKKGTRFRLVVSESTKHLTVF